METQDFGNDVYYITDNIAAVSQEDVEWLKTRAQQSERRRARICAHRTQDDPLHEMMTVQMGDTYYAPHTHTGKSQSFYVIEGKVDMVFFDDEGAITEIVQMGDQSTGLNFYCRHADSKFHYQIIQSDILVLHETINGPFDRSHNVFAPWAPKEGDQAGIEKYLSSLDKSINSWNSK